MTNLKQLNLVDNQIVVFDRNALDGLNNLKLVCLNANPISVLFPDLLLNGIWYSNSKCIVNLTSKC